MLCTFSVFLQKIQTCSKHCKHIRLDIYQSKSKKTTTKIKGTQGSANWVKSLEFGNSSVGLDGLFVLLNKLLKVRSTRKPFEVCEHIMSDLPEMFRYAVM